MTKVFNPLAPIGFDEVGSGSGGVNIGDTIGNSPTSDGVLYVDSSGNLQNDNFKTTATSYFGGAVTGFEFYSPSLPQPRFGTVNLSGIGQPSAWAFATDASTTMQTFWVDTDSLTSYALMNINPSSPSDSFFLLGFGSGGVASVQTLQVNGSGAAFTVPIVISNSGTLTLNSTTAVSSILDEDDMASDSATALATQQSIKAYVDANAGGSWGSITGTLSDQTDLQTALDSKLSDLVDDTSPQLGGNLDLNSNTITGFTASRALETDGSGNLQVSAVTSTELNYLDGVTSSIQTQLNAKIENAAGSDTQIQYNNSNAFAGSSNFTYDYTNNILAATGTKARFGGGSPAVTATGFMYRNSSTLAAVSGYSIGAYFNPSVQASADSDLIAGTYFTFTPDENSHSSLSQYMVYMQNTYPNAIALKIRAAPSQADDILDIVTNSNVSIFTVNYDGRFEQRMNASTQGTQQIAAMKQDIRSFYTAASTQYANSLQYIVDISDVTSYWGNYSEVKQDGGIGTRDVGLMGGYYAFIRPASGSGTVGEAIGYRTRIYNNSTVDLEVTTAIGYHVESANAGNGSITTNYGVKVENQTEGDTNYAIHTGTGQVQFGDILKLSASTTSRATLNIPSGTAPTSPQNGDIWSDGSDIKVRLGGTTYTLTKA